MAEPADGGGSRTGAPPESPPSVRAPDTSADLKAKAGRLQTPVVVVLSILVLLGLSTLASLSGNVLAPGLLFVLAPAAVLGFFVGTARQTSPRVPVVAGILVVVAYGVYLVGGFAFLALLPSWAEDQNSDGGLGYVVYAYGIGALLFGVGAGVALLSIWAGARVSRMLARSGQRDLYEGQTEAEHGAHREAVDADPQEAKIEDE